MHARAGRQRRVSFVTASALALLVSLPSFAADISYVYDEAGRLRAVIDPAANTAVYAYDAVGNLTGITQQPSSTLAVLQFTPASSPVGTTVTIYGTGFSAMPPLQPSHDRDGSPGRGAYDHLWL